MSQGLLAQEKIIPNNHVEGKIYDLQTNLPIANATIVIEFGMDKYTAVTDANGKYNIKTTVRYVDKEYYIKVTHKDYYDLNGVVFVKEYALRNFGLKERIVQIPNTIITDTIKDPAVTLNGFASNNWTILIDISSSMNESEKMDETVEPIEYAYFYCKEKEINKFLIPNRDKVMNFEKFDSERVVIQYETIIILLSIKTGNVMNYIDLNKDFITDIGVVTGSGIFNSLGEHYIHLCVMVEKDEVNKWKKYILDKEFKIVQEIKEDWYQLFYS